MSPKRLVYTCVGYAHSGRTDFDQKSNPRPRLNSRNTAKRIQRGVKKKVRQLSCDLSSDE